MHIVLGIFFLVFLNSPVSAHDQTPISIVVPYSAGSAQDVFTRLISEPLASELKTRVMVVNKPGASGTIASAFVANAKPDGRTYLMAASSHHLAGALYPGLKYHALHSFRGVAFFGASDFVLITPSSMQTPDLASFVARVRANPNVFNYASAGNGSTTHVGMLGFLKRANLQMTHIPLKGTGEIINEILSGRVQAAMVSLLSAYGYRSDPRFQFLAMTGRQRSEKFSQMPTVMESGYPNFQWRSWGGLIGPAATPTEKTQEMNRAVIHVLNDPSMKNRLTNLGISLQSLSLGEFDELLKNDWQQARSLMTELRIEPD
jgi:tripartite-type tricarboxylate transporter receptor subunit TctC